MKEILALDDHWEAKKQASQPSTNPKPDRLQMCCYTFYTWLPHPVGGQAHAPTLTHLIQISRMRLCAVSCSLLESSLT